MKKAIITDHGFPSIEIQRAIIESAGFQLEEAHPICKTEDDVIARCRDADVLLVQWAPVTRRVLQALPRVKCLVRYGVGVNNLDLEGARDLGVTVANVPDFCVEEVSDHAMAMILALGRRIPQDHSQIMRGGWGINPFRPIPAFADMTLGLIGFGQIGRRVAQKAAAFGFAIVAYDPQAPDEVFARAKVRRVDLAALVSTADVVSLHCPLTAETQHMIDRDVIGRMKRGALLVNTSRGPVVNEADLIEALESGQIGGAGLDVFEEEPLPSDSRLRGFSNVILTSHAASVSEKAVETLQVKAAEAARDFLLGKRPASVVV